MIRRMLKAAAAVMTLLCLCGSALALSDRDYKALLQDPGFKEADEALTGAWQEAKNNLSAAQFKDLKADQRKWIAGGRDEEAAIFIESGMKKAEAYAEATMNRVVSINDVISKAYLMKNPDGAQGLYTRDVQEQPATLEVYWYDKTSPELYVVVSAVQSGPENVNMGTFKGHGNLAENGVVEVYGEDDDTIKITIKFDGEQARISTSQQFKESGYLGQNVILDGAYRRIRSE